MTPAEFVLDARKALTAIGGAVAEAITLGVLHGQAEQWATAAIAIATALLVYVVPNGTKPESEKVSADSGAKSGGNLSPTTTSGSGASIIVNPTPTAPLPPVVPKVDPPAGGRHQA